MKTLINKTEANVEKRGIRIKGTKYSISSDIIATKDDYDKVL